jgi:predicted phage terminase large subunit-like protein
MRGINIIPMSHGGIKKEIRFLTSTGSYADKSYFFCKDASWYPAFESELLQFPKGSHDDMVDCLSQFAKWYVDFANILDYWCTVV